MRRPAQRMTILYYNRRNRQYSMNSARIYVRAIATKRDSRRAPSVETICSQNIRLGWEKAKISDAEAANWKRFVGVAREGGREIDKCLPRLRSVKNIWGKKIVQHYGWAKHGEKYCKELCSTARRVPDLAEFLIKTGQLLKRRLEMRGRRKLRGSINPIDLVDLKNVMEWDTKWPYVKSKDRANVELPYKHITIEDVSEGYGLDKYGLIVHKDFAILRAFSSDQIRDDPAISSDPINSEAENLNPPRPENPQTTPAGVPENSLLPPSPPPRTPQSSTGTSPIESDVLADSHDAALDSDTTMSARSNSPTDERDGSTSRRSEALEDFEDDSSKDDETSNEQSVEDSISDDGECLGQLSESCATSTSIVGENATLPVSTSSLTTASCPPPAAHDSGVRP